MHLKYLQMLMKIILNSIFKVLNYISAIDFANRATTVISDPIIIDSTSPLATNSPITIENRLIISNTEINAWLVKNSTVICN